MIAMNPIGWRRFSLFVVLAMLALVRWSAHAASAAELSVDDAMYQDPELNLPKWRLIFSKKFKPLWLQALDRPDAETRRLAADTFTIASGRGMTELEDAADHLQAVLKADRDPVVRRAAARALVALHAKSAAEPLAEAAQQDGLLMAQIAEPALARWGDPTLRDAWLQRLETPDVERGLLMLAIDALGVTRESQAAARLTSFVDDGVAPREVRLAAARALAQIHDTGLTEQAEKLADRASQPEFLDRLLAANLLARHTDEPSVRLLERLATDKEPAVAVAALGRLHTLELRLSLPFAAQAIVSADAGLRRLGAEILVAKADVAAVQNLGPLLNDRNPGVRRFVAQQLAEFGTNEALRPNVLEQAEKVLAQDEWRGLEQAALVLGRLDHKPAAPRLVELLPHARGEVAISAAWALRKLRVVETLPAMLRHAEVLHDAMPKMNAPTHSGRQCRQLCQAFGEMGYREAEPLLRKFVPKNMALDIEARAAACWSLGYFYANQPENDLVAPFAERLADVNSTPPELPPVRQMVAIGMGRMKAQSQLPLLKKFAGLDGVSSPPGLASAWAVEQLTGEKPELMLFRDFGITNWFLEPSEQ